MSHTTIYYCTVLPDLFLSLFLEVGPCQEERLKKLDAISSSVDRVEKKMICLDEELDGIEKGVGHTLMGKFEAKCVP